MDPVSAFGRAGSTPPASLPAAGPASQVLGTGIALGASLAAFVGSTLTPRLPPSHQGTVAAHAKRAATLGACAGLALWSVATLVDHARAARLGAAIAGVSVGFVDGGRSVGSLN